MLRQAASAHLQEILGLLKTPQLLLVAFHVDWLGEEVKALVLMILRCSGGSE